MGCGCGGGGGRRVTKYRVTANDGTQTDYLTKGEADKARTDQGATRPVRAVQVAVAPATK